VLGNKEERQPLEQEQLVAKTTWRLENDIEEITETTGLGNVERCKTQRG